MPKSKQAEAVASGLTKANSTILVSTVRGGGAEKQATALPSHSTAHSTRPQVSPDKLLLLLLLVSITRSVLLLVVAACLAMS